MDGGGGGVGSGDVDYRDKVAVLAEWRGTGGVRDGSCNQTFHISNIQRATSLLIHNHFLYSEECLPSRLTANTGLSVPESLPRLEDDALGYRRSLLEKIKYFMKEYLSEK